MENSQLRADLERLRLAVAGGGEGEENMAVREISGRGGRDILGRGGHTQHCWSRDCTEIVLTSLKAMLLVRTMAS